MEEKRKIEKKRYELAFGFKEIMVVVFKEALMSESVPQSGSPWQGYNKAEWNVKEMRVI